MGLAPPLQESHHFAEDRVQGGPQSYQSGRTLEVRRGQRHSTDAVPSYSFQARLWMQCIWDSIEYQCVTTGQHP